MIRVVHVACALSLLSCSEHDSAGRNDAGPVIERRVFRPRPGRVLAPPPHNIHAGGIGPYSLGASRKEIYKVLSHGPRVELLNIDRVVDYSLVRTEQDGLLIGTSRRSGVQFLVAVDKEIAHTDKGEIIGVPVDKIEEVAGEQAVIPRAMDPRIRIHVGLPNARIITDGRRVEAVLVADDRRFEPPEPEPAEAEDELFDPGDAGVEEEPPVLTGRPCEHVAAMRENAAAIIDASRISKSRSPVITYGCGSTALAVVTADSQVAVITGADDKPRRSASSAIDGLAFAAPLDVDGDGSDEVAVVTRRRAETSVKFRVEVLSPEMSSLASREAYELHEATVRWVGAQRLEDTDLLLELESRSPGQVRIGGIYIQRNRGGLRNVAPLKTKILRVRRRRASKPASPKQIQAPPLPPPPDGGAAPKSTPSAKSTLKPKSKSKSKPKPKPDKSPP